MLFRRSTLRALLVLCWTFPSHAADVTVTLSPNDGFVVKNATGTTERLRVNEATGNISRNGALFVHTTGMSNLFVGPGAGNQATTSTGRNSAFGINALAANTTGSRNTAAGLSVLASNTTGSVNTAAGSYALRSNTTGSGNTATGADALRTNTAGSQNTATGSDALFYNTTGAANTATGAGALASNTTGIQNTATGYIALFFNSTGDFNTAVGSNALYFNTAGGGNTAIGGGALANNTTGSSNTAVGRASLSSNTTGYFNIAVGHTAGSNQTTGHDNIYLANTGIAGESGQIKIGTVGTHTGATFAGIHNATSTSGIAVLVNASGVLGTTTSSARFKRDIADMGDASDVLMQLHPVVFHYKEEAVGNDAASELQYGLVAEEVADVAPELVAPGTDGKPYSVRYHVLPAMLLNEVQRQRREIAVHEQRDMEQERTIAALQARLARLEARVE